MDAMSRQEFEQAVEQGAILRADSYGPKVYAAADSKRIVKLFRRKRLITLRGNQATRFCRNAALLRERGFRSVAVERCGYQPEIARQVVIYRSLAGCTLRDALSREWRPELVEQLARYLARLHAQGIYFRSIHLDNILVQANGEFALIDVLDLREWHFRKLGSGARLRNFRHLFRYREDQEFIVRFGFERFWACYAQHSGMDRPVMDRLHDRLRRHWAGLRRMIPVILLGLLAADGVDAAPAAEDCLAAPVLSQASEARLDQ